MVHFINNTLSDDNDFSVKGSLPLHFTTNQPPHLIGKVVHVVNKMLKKREISKAQKMLYAAVAQRWKLFDYFRKIINFFSSLCRLLLTIVGIDMQTITTTNRS